MDPNDMFDVEDRTDGGATRRGGGSPTPPAPRPEAQPTEVLTAPEDELTEPRDPPPTVPLSEHVRMRERAEQAESKANQLQSRAEELERVLAETRAAVDSVERRREIDLALMEADAIDLESARVLTELALDRMDDADVALAVRELRERKPFLFNPPAGKGARAGSAMSAGADASGAPLAEAASRATRSGDRRALLRYLQIRRGAAQP